MLLNKASELSINELESIEKLTVRWISQALFDFGIEAYDIFLLSPDQAKDIAEDVTREVLDRLPGFNVPQRIFGTVDYKRARYVILPEQSVRQALFVESKAEKDNRTATIQMSQTSMWIRQVRSGREINEKGLLPEINFYGTDEYLTTTALIHYRYEDIDNKHYLRDVTVAAIPNGRLQDRYNPDATDTIWLAGRNAPSLGEDFRVRLSFARLKDKANWRVQRIQYDAENRTCIENWED
jgi:hypothetical protein